MATVKFPSEMPPASSIGGNDKLMISKEGSGEAYQATFNQAKDYLNITGIELEPLNGGETEGAALVVANGPIGENRTADVVSGKWYNFGDGPILADANKRWKAYWNGTSWSLVDMGSLPEISPVNIVEQGNHEPVDSDGAWQGDKIIKDKIDDFTDFKNLFNKGGIVPGELLDIPSGTPEGMIRITSEIGWSRSPYIFLDPGTYTLSGIAINSNAMFAGLFNDDVTDTEWGERVISNTFTTTEPKYFAFSVKSPSFEANIDAIQLEKGSSATEYEAYGTKVKPSSIKMAKVVEKDNNLPASSDLVYLATKPINDMLLVGNYFDKNNIVVGELLDVPAGTPTGKIKITASANWNRSSYIGPLYKGKYKILGITIGANTMFAGLFNDTVTDAEWGDRVTGNTFEITSDQPKFLTFSVKNSSFQADLDAIQVKQLDMPDEYMEYGKSYIDGKNVLSSADTVISSPTELYVTENAVFVRNSYDSTFDIIIEFQYNNVPTTNGTFSTRRTYKAPKSASIFQNLSAYLVHNTNDSISALGNDPYWFVLGQHGYLIPRVTSTGNTFAVGEKVTDQLSREYDIIFKDGDFIYLSPKITVSGTNITRDWTNGSPTISSLSTLDSSKTHAVSATARHQVKPMMIKKSQRILLDGAEVKSVGVYNGSEVELVDVYSCVNPVGAVFNGVSEMTGNELIDVTQSYYMKGLSVYLTCNFEMKDFLPFIKYHGVQPLGLVQSGAFTPYAMYPKVKPQPANGSLLAVDWNYPQPNSGNTNVYSKYLFNVNSNDLKDVNDIPDRTIQYNRNSSGQYQLGFASGLDLESGLTAKNVRPSYVNEAFQLAKSVDTPNKTYFRVLTSSAFEGGVLPSSFMGQFNSYFAYYLPKDNIQSYQINTKEGAYIYIHTQDQFDKSIIEVSGIDGRKIEVIENSGVEILTDRVIDSKVFVKSASSDAGYIVLKTV